MVETVRSNLEGEDEEKWNEMKQFYGVLANPELFRIIFNKFYRNFKEAREKGRSIFTV